MDSQNKYWFTARTYGWGWGLPPSWQGWVVYAAYAASLAFICYFLPPAVDVTLFSIGIAASTVVLVAVCWLKGEPPHWRWGGR